MSSIISLDHEIMQLPDTVGILWVYQTSQRIERAINILPPFRFIGLKSRTLCEWRNVSRTLQNYTN